MTLYCFTLSTLPNPISDLSVGTLISILTSLAELAVNEPTSTLLRLIVNVALLTVGMTVSAGNAPTSPAVSTTAPVLLLTLVTGTDVK